MTTLVIDCNNLGYAAAHTTGSFSFGGHPTGVIYGFLSQVLSLSGRFQTSRFVFCWDSRQSYRKLIYPRYKENRHKKDLSEEEQENLRIIFHQFQQLHQEILPKLGFKNNYRQTGYEADDLIAHVVQRFPGNHVIVSSDNDLWQLIDLGRDTSIVIFNPRKKNILDHERFMSSFGIPPRKWAEVKAIAGCSSDNVEGIPGVGEKTAIKYLTGGLTKGKVHQKIVSSDPIIRRNRELVYLPFAAKVPIKIKRLNRHEVFSPDRFVEVFDQFGFESFLERDKFRRWVRGFCDA